MIFVTLGSQKFQFNRLLRKLDDLVAQGKITDEILAQVGYSDYIPLNYEGCPFIDRNAFSEIMGRTNLIITHGGTGAIINGLKAGKKVIAVPRLAEFGEHVDNHQLQMLRQFDSMGIIRVCYDLGQLEEIYGNISNEHFELYKSNTGTILESIEEYLNI